MRKNPPHARIGDRRPAGAAAQLRHPERAGSRVHAIPAQARRRLHEQGTAGAFPAAPARLEARAHGRGRPHDAAHEGRCGELPDPNDRATQESEFGLELRTRDRERKLLKKIDSALSRIDDGTYGYCEETGDEIGLRRLEARPVATLCVEAQERRELAERQFRDREDQYR